VPDEPAKVVAYIGLGSNIEPEQNLARALELLARRVDLLSISTFYRTAPLGRSDQPAFLNGACCVATSLAPRTLKFDVLRGIERALGRVRTADKFAPRTADLDILLYGDTICADDDLRIPDPEIRERPFVAVPLLELAPDAVLPDTGERLADLSVAHRREGLRAVKGFSEELQARFQNERQAR
jgi:2-amino-4-hydroxy-6-hydroxymethyldihydropteridine diphosphokinase